MRVGEALALRWCDVHLKRKNGSFGFVQVREGKSLNARRAVPLTSRARELLRSCCGCSCDAYIFADESGRVLTVSYLDHLHAQVRKQVKLASEFVVHSLRHTYLTRLGLAGVEAFTIMRLAGHSSVTISQRYVHPTGYAAENAISRLDAMNQRATSRLTAPISPTVPALKGGQEESAMHSS